VSRTIEILVSPQGETTLTTQGFSGNSCREASEFLEKALGEGTSEQLTAEFYAEATEEENVREGQ
jgi:hypothetical protein